MADGFLGRWSQRKHQAREGKPLQEPVREPTAPAMAAHPLQVAQAAQTPVPPTPPAVQAEPPPPPTLAEAQALTTDSDFKPYLARGVAPEVRNTAMKKLFADPHFNVMDGLDIYIDDYSIPDPLPAAMLRQMASARFMGLLDDDEDKTKAPALSPAMQGADSTDASDGQGMAQSGASPEISDTPATAALSHPDEPALPANPHPHDHADLRLQPDNAPQRESAGRGAS